MTNIDKKYIRGILRSSIFIMLVAVIAFAASNANAIAGEGGHSQSAMQSIASGDVCMVNDRVMGRPQIAVEYEGKTYYGCCMNCVSKIKNNRAVRYSTDPVTGLEIDKATAYILEGPAGEAIYFESAETAMKYTQTSTVSSGK